MRRAALTTLLLAFPVCAQETAWPTNFDEAVAAAKKDQKVVLVNFTSSDGGGDAQKLKDEVFGTPEFSEWATKNVVLLEVDLPKKAVLADELKKQNEGLKRQFKVTATPTVLFLDGEGKQIGKLGYEAGGVEKWLALADAQRTPPPPESAWMTDFKAAQAKAKKEKKVVLADFTGSDWCGWCIKLKDEVFSKPEFLEWAEEHVVLLELDYPRNTKLSEELTKQNKELQEEYQISGFPTILFLDSKGKQVGRSGYVEGGPEAWIAAAEKELGIKSKKKKSKKS